LTPDADGDIIDAALSGAYTRTIWVSAASATLLSATANAPGGATGDAKIRMLVRNQAGQTVTQTWIGVNRPVEALYAVDGTWATAAKNYNVRRFEQRYQGVDGTDKHYYNGPGPDGDLIGGATGGESPIIVTAVEGQITTDYATALQRHRKLVIDMVGWSRGGVIVATVAKDLSTVRLTPTGFEIVAKGPKSIPVHWLGLFDAVKRMAPEVVAPNKPWAATLTANVVTSDHLVKSTLMPKDNRMNLTVMTLGNPVQLPNNNPYQSVFYIRRRNMLDHVYIGTSPEALQWMIQRARMAAVPVE